MITGTKQSKYSPAEVSERLRAALAAGNFRILGETAEAIRFEHGSHMTSTASMLPKRGSLEFRGNNGGTRVDYAVEVTGFARYWMWFIGIAFCWLVFPFILCRRALTVHPRLLMENLLQAV